MQIALNVVSIGLAAALIYGLTRQQKWGQKLAIGCFVALIGIQILQPSDGCYRDWDGHSNPTVCD